MKLFNIKRKRGLLPILGMVFVLLLMGSSRLSAGSIGQTGSEPNWIGLSSSQAKTPEINIITSNFNEVIFEVKISGMWSEEVETKEGVFNQLTIPDCGIMTVIGEPRLPVISKMVQIPYGAEVEVEVVSAEFKESSLEEWGIGNRIVPVQPSIPKVEGAWKDAQFVIDQDLYQKDAFSPAVVAKEGEIGAIRGHRFVTVEIYPVSYNPKAGSLRLYSSVQVKVTLTGSDITTTENMLYRYASPPFEELCQEFLINYESYADIVKGAPALPIGYLIITHQDFYDNIAPVVEWKTKKGFHVTVLQVPDIGSTTTAIKDSIQSAYDNWEIPPTYVLFVGDVGFIPTFTGSYSSTATDLYYVKMDGDYFADIMRGRLPARSPTEADYMVNKLLYYENPTSFDFDWMRRMCFIASDDADLTAEKTHRFVIQNYLAPNGVICDSIWARTGGSTSDITNNVNNGRTIVCYSGHGYEYGWSCVPYDQDDVRSLTNADEYPFVLSHACLTGKFNVTECFGETWAKVDNKGGIAFWGASNYTYWDEDDILEKRMFQAAFVETCYSIVSMTDKALWYLYSYYGGGGMSRYYLDAYNVMGEPSVDLWTYVTDSLFVDYPSSIPQGSNTVTVTVEKSGSVPVYGALVCLYKEGEVFETGYTDINGEVTLYPSPVTLGSVEVTVTAHNCLPHQGAMGVTTRVGDANDDGITNVADIVFLINYLFKAGPEPDPLENADINCDGEINSEDVVYLVNYLFRNGPSPCL
jgi:hypothetical protein